MSARLKWAAADGGQALDSLARPGLRIPTARVRNLAAILPTLAELGAAPDAVIRQAGMDPKLFLNLEAVIPFSALGRLVTECVKATGCEGFGLRVGMKTRPSGMGLTGLVSIHSPTVREGLDVITATLQTSDTGGATFLNVRRGVASFGYAVTAPAIESADQIVDAAIAIAFNVMRQLCGAAWRPDAVRLTREPPSDRGPFAKFFEAPVEFGAKAACLVFDAAILDQPVRDRDPHAADILAPLLREAAAKAQGDFVSTTRAMIRTQLAAGTLSREGVCRALSLSVRTFVHRLEAHGLTYSGLADEAKYDAAQDLLRKGETIAETAARLGFADPSAFTRAFKAWSGATPARWRAERARPRPGILSTFPISGRT
jgi:AraC-like DNA-binding protein